MLILTRGDTFKKGTPLFLRVHDLTLMSRLPSVRDSIYSNSIGKIIRYDIQR
jgi:hypothetical protein